MEKITSLANEKIKYAVRLGESASLRKKTGEFLLEGARLCFDAVRTGIEIRRAFFTSRALLKYSDYVEEILKKCGKSFEISENVSKKLSDAQSPQGVFCVCGTNPRPDPGEINPKGKYIALENIRDPANLGAISRSAEAFGLDGLIISGGCDVYNPKAQRASMGALLRLNVFYTDDLTGLLERANSLGMKTFACVPRGGAKSVTDVDKSGGAICCVGNEGSGLSREAAEACSEKTTLPMKGKAESLNAAAAAAIVAWELKK